MKTKVGAAFVAFIIIYVLKNWDIHCKLNFVLSPVK